MSTVAVFAVLGGGTAMAHGLIGTSDIRDRAVTNPKIAKDTLGTNKIADGAVVSSKLGPITERSVTVPVSDGSRNQTTAECDPGETVVSGGAVWDIQNVNLRLQLSERSGNGWRVGGANNTGNHRQLTVHAYCLEG